MISIQCGILGAPLEMNVFSRRIRVRISSLWAAPPARIRPNIADFRVSDRVERHLLPLADGSTHGGGVSVMQPTVKSVRIALKRGSSGITRAAPSAAPSRWPVRLPNRVPKPFS